MTYLIHSPNVAIRRLESLTGVTDAPLGSIAKTEDGDTYALLASGWVDVTSAAPPDGSSVTVQDGDVSVVVQIVGGVATIPDGYTLTEDE